VVNKGKPVSKRWEEELDDAPQGVPMGGELNQHTGLRSLYGGKTLLATSEGYRWDDRVKDLS